MLISRYHQEWTLDINEASNNHNKIISEIGKGIFTRLHESIHNISLSDWQNIFLFDVYTHILMKGSNCYKQTQFILWTHAIDELLATPTTIDHISKHVFLIWYIEIFNSLKGPNENWLRWKFAPTIWAILIVIQTQKHAIWVKIMTTWKMDKYLIQFKGI